MFVQFGASGAASRGYDLGRAMDRVLHDLANSIGFLKRRSRRQRDVDIEGAFIEWRQKLAAHKRDQHEATTSIASDAPMIW